MNFGDTLFLNYGCLNEKPKPKTAIIQRIVIQRILAVFGDAVATEQRALNNKIRETAKAPLESGQYQGVNGHCKLQYKCQLFSVFLLKRKKGWRIAPEK